MENFTFRTLSPDSLAIGPGDPLRGQRWIYRSNGLPEWLWKRVLRRAALRRSAEGENTSGRVRRTQIPQELDD